MDAKELQASLESYVSASAKLTKEDYDSRADGLLIPPPGFTLKDVGDFFANALGGLVGEDVFPKDLFASVASIRIESLLLATGGDAYGYNLEFTLVWDGEWAFCDAPKLGIKSLSISMGICDGVVNAQLSGTLEIGPEIQLVVQADFPAEVLAAHLVAPDPTHYPSAEQLFEHFKLPSLPDGKEGANAGLQLNDLKMLADLRTKFFTLHLSLTHVLQVGSFSVDAIEADAMYVDGVTGFRFWGVFTIATTSPITVMLLAEKAGDVWRFGGGTAGDIKVKVNELIEQLAQDFGVNDFEKVPDVIDLDIKAITVGFETGPATERFSFFCDIEFQPDSGADSPSTELTVWLDFNKTEAGTTLDLGATLSIGDLDFALAFERQTVTMPKAESADSGATNTFAALFSAKQPLNVRNLLQDVTSEDALIELVPADFEIGLRDVVFAYRSQNEASEYLLSVALDLSKAQLSLSNLPAVGGYFAEDEHVGLDDLQVIVANQDIKRDHLEPINAFLKDLPTPPLLFEPPPPKSGNAVADDVVLGRGFNLAATLNLASMGKIPLYAGARRSAAPAAAGDAEPPAAAQSAQKPEQEPGPDAGTTTGAQIPATRSAATAGTASGNVTWFQLNRALGPVTLQKIGVRYDNGRAWAFLSASVSAAGVTLDLQGLGLGFLLKNLADVAFSLDGIGLSFAQGPVKLTGVFLRRDAPVYGADGKPTTDANGQAKVVTQYAGGVRIELPAFTILAVGAYGQMDDGSPTLFIYGALSAAAGGGIELGPVKITALALGMGINRRVIVPPIDGVHSFPLVSMVMGDDAAAAQGAGAAAQPPAASTSDPAQIMAGMLDVLPAQPGQYFGALGLRFTLFETIDCFALAIVQGGNDLEIAILGIGRFRKPDEGKALCYVEIDLLIVIRPGEGIFRAQAVLANSWILDGNCQLTGGFALFIWYGGEHKGDFVISVGGYHPRFVAPAHYPTVPRLGFNWKVNDEVFLKGEAYFALTPSSIMAGGRLEGSFNSGPIQASFVAYVDFIVGWKPLHYEITAGILIHAALDLGLGTLSLTVSVDLAIAGPPLHGTATLKLGPISATITFGEQPAGASARIPWAEFETSFLDRQMGAAEASESQEGYVPGPRVHRLALVRGQITTPGVATANNGNQQQAEDRPWLVRGDEMVFAVATGLPATTLAVGTLDKGVECLPKDSSLAARPLVHRNTKDLAPEISVKPLDAMPSVTGAVIGARPAGITSLNAPMIVSIVREIIDSDGTVTLKSYDNIGQWRVELAQSAMPSAIWSPEALDTTHPTADTIAGCITGIAQLRPPAAAPRGQKVAITNSAGMGWDPLTDRTFAAQAATQPSPAPAPTDLDVQGIAAGSAQARMSMAEALCTLGFDEMAPYARTASASFRPVEAMPLVAS